MSSGRVLSLIQSSVQPLGWLIDAAVELGEIEVRQGESLRYQVAADLRPRNLTPLRDSVLAIDAANAATLDLLDYAASIYPASRERGECRAGAVRAAEIALWLAYFRNDNPTYAVNNWIGALAAIDRVANHSRSAYWRSEREQGVAPRFC